MAISDQKYRGPSQKPLEVYPSVLDSLIKAKGYTKQTFELLPELEQGKLKHLAFKLLSRHLTPKMAEHKSYAKKQKRIDAANTKKLIEIVLEHGWVTKNSLDCKGKFTTALIFRHAPEKYRTQVRNLIEREKEAQRISAYEYYIIDNHLKGRPPLTKGRSDFPNQSWFLSDSR
ncbi:MAG: hypothetical protein VX772_02605 [Bacteroidota bacterium]|uniref:Uncharacterized protein n=1 Tax=Flagellimonas okinawensis TaxID=3031324 RepID=A0ABT5XKR0_9FLAO|nr:hypothetical protein [[Muricauda] okinawensis]MDF0706457.1 hypothetical protein [[Muricauda] okinawensis]MEC8831224.1 hypothetical protein [Bacteroidota bacterium]